MSNQPTKTVTPLDAEARDLDSLSLPGLFVMAVRTALQRIYRRIPPRYVNTMLSVCGLFMLISPLLMWIAWSVGMGLVLWGLICVCFAIISLVAWLAPREPF